MTKPLQKYKLTVDNIAKSASCRSKGHNQKEEVQRESEERYRAIVENSFDVIFILDANGIFRYVSPSWKHHFGYAAEEVTGKPFAPVVHADDIEICFSYMQKVLASGTPGTSPKYRVLCIDGSWKTFIANGSRFTDAKGDILFHGIGRDISELEQMLTQVRNSEEKFTKAFNMSPALMSISTIEEGRYIDVNDRFCKISGFERQDVIGKTSVEIGWIPAAQRQKMKDVLQRDGQIKDVELELTRPDGSVITVLYTAVIITIAEQKRLLSIALDISERKKALDTLFYVDECFTQALNGANHILYRLNVKKGGYDYLSPAAEKILGIPYADVLKYSIEQVLDCIHPDDRILILATLDNAIRTRTSNAIDLELEYRFRKTDGEYCWLLDSTRLIVDDAGEIQYLFGSAYDITEQKIIQNSLKASEERYLAIVNTQTEFVDRYLPGGILTFVNSALCQYMGVMPADLIGKSFYPFIHEDERQQLIDTIEALSTDCPCFDHESRIVFPDGSVRWNSWANYAIFDQDGKVIEYQSVGRDITRQKLAELAEINYRDKLSVAMEAAKAGMWDRNLITGEIIWPRETFLLYGLDPEHDEASLASWLQTIHPDDLECVSLQVQEAIEQKHEFRYEYRIILPDGSIRWLRAQGRPFYDIQGLPLRISGITIDITDLKTQEEALQLSEQMARAILSATNDLILFIDPDGTILMANEAVAERFGHTVETFVGTNIFPYFPEDLRRLRQEKLAKAVMTRSPVRYEDDRDGRTFDNCLFPVISSDKIVSGIAVFSRDISDRKQYEADLKKANELLETRVDERTASLAAANEQIKQISFQLIKAGEQERIRIAAELHDQVGQSLLLAKMKVDALAGDSESNVNNGKATDISKLLEECIQDIRTLTFAMRPHLLDSAGLEAALEWLCKSIYENYRIKVDFSTNCLSHHLSSEQRYSLYQAVRELLLNVVKHAGVNNAELTLKADENMLIVQVSDKGRGFETTAKSYGPASDIGLGLFNVQQRIELMGGSCWLYSKPGQGTVVTLSIPTGD